MIDFSASGWHIPNGEKYSYASGRSEKVILESPDREIGFFKYPKSCDTTEHISEHLASKIANLLDIKCAKIDIGTYKGRIGSMSYRINDNFVDLIEGIWFISVLYPDYDQNSLYSAENDEYYSLKMIVGLLDVFALDKEFMKIPILDFLIGNSDRHQSNWALLAKKKPK